MRKTNLTILAIFTAFVLSVALVPAPAAQAGHQSWSVNLAGHHGSSIYFGNHGWGIQLNPGCYRPPVYCPPVYTPPCYTPPRYSSIWYY